MWMPRSRRAISAIGGRMERCQGDGRARAGQAAWSPARSGGPAHAGSPPVVLQAVSTPLEGSIWCAQNAVAGGRGIGVVVVVPRLTQRRHRQPGTRSPSYPAC